MSPADSLSRLPWPLAIFLCLTLGLAPFAPPHVAEKIGMLLVGELKRPIDWFDLFFHGAPWLLLLAKGVLSLRTRLAPPASERGIEKGKGQER